MQNRFKLSAFLQVFALAILMTCSFSDQTVAADSEKTSTADPTKFTVKKLANLDFTQSNQSRVSPAAAAGPLKTAHSLCDVYLPVPSKESELGDPADTSVRRWPVVLVIHGGGWITGNKWTMERHARQLAERGIAAVSMNYRLAPQHKFPSQVDDVRSALIWMSENADRFSFDMAHVGLYGYSAGGHLASLTAMTADEPWERIQLTTHWKRDDPRLSKVPKIRAVCVGGPPTDFRDVPPDSLVMSFFLGGTRRNLPEVYSAASPICFASPDDPPFSIIHGDVDAMVPITNGQNLHQALVEHNVESQFHRIVGRGHFLAFASPKLSEHLLAFFENQLLIPLNNSGKR